MDPDRLARLEILVTQVLEESRDFRQEVRDKFARVDEKFAGVERDIKLLQTAMLETRSELKADIKRVEAKLDQTIADHGARLDRLEGAAE